MEVRRQVRQKSDQESKWSTSVRDGAPGFEPELRRRVARQATETQAGEPGSRALRPAPEVVRGEPRHRVSGSPSERRARERRHRAPGPSSEVLEKQLKPVVRNWLHTLNPISLDSTPTHLLRREANVMDSVRAAIGGDLGLYRDPYIAAIWTVRDASLAHPSVTIEPISEQRPDVLLIQVELELTEAQLDAIDRLQARKAFETPVWIRVICMSGQRRVLDIEPEVQIGVGRPERLEIPLPEFGRDAPRFVFVRAQYSRGTFFTGQVEV